MEGARDNVDFVPLGMMKIRSSRPIHNGLGSIYRKTMFGLSFYYTHNPTPPPPQNCNIDLSYTVILSIHSKGTGTRWAGWEMVHPENNVGVYNCSHLILFLYKYQYNKISATTFEFSNTLLPKMQGGQTQKKGVQNTKKTFGTNNAPISSLFLSTLSATPFPVNTLVIVSCNYIIITSQ